MNSLTHRLLLKFKALRELGPSQTGQYALYRLGLAAGYFRRREARLAAGKRDAGPVAIAHPLALPDREEIRSVIGGCEDALMAEAEEILSGQVRLFGGPPVPLRLAVPGPLLHWTEYERKSRSAGEEDIKFLWEPARFGWAFTLGRAYHLNRDERHAGFFWNHFEIFDEANPPYLGPNWISAQEAGLRIMALAFSAQVFAGSQESTPERLNRLSLSLEAHAERIPPTLAYARAQNNNHLLTEATGLVTASLFIPDHPKAKTWSRLGWRWFNFSLQSQIADDGTYVQHSCNYHRLMLHAALWVYALQKPFPGETSERLASATRWLLALVDPQNGRVPNLGPNDGANILPLSPKPFEDYRPVLQAASLAFLGRPAFENGPWDEMAYWLRVQNGEGIQAQPPLITSSRTSGPLTAPHVLRAEDHSSWAYLRAARFTGRPGHADQLHFDLWWQGLNLAQDAGTYLYNAPPPWNNALGETAVHNTLTIEGQDQMTHAGRFLWLDWAQADVIDNEAALDGSFKRLVAEHDGYRRLGLVHRREVTVNAGGRWIVQDSVFSTGKRGTDKWITQPILVRLHWLLPDWPWEIETIGSGEVTVRLTSPLGHILLKTRARQEDLKALYTLTRAGKRLSGKGPDSLTWGWVSPTYGTKKPALSFSLEVLAHPPITLLSEWILP